jgi:selenocysteine-specific elongation factor
VARAELPDLNGWLMDPTVATDAKAALATVVAEHAVAHPLDAGIALADAARKLRIDDPQLVIGLVEPPLVYAEGRIRPGGSPLPDFVNQALKRLHDLLADRPFRAPDSEELRELGLDRRALAAAARAGRLLRLSDSVVLQTGSAERAVGLLRTLPQPFTTSQAREILDTSRRVVLPLLDHLDRARLTRRLPDDRRMVVAGQTPDKD